MKQNYSHVLYSVPVDLDFGCPNRNADGSGGCSFCPANGARAVQTGDMFDIKEQIQKGIFFAKKRYGASCFMLYIQAYTATFSSLSEQKQAYNSLLKLQEFKAISIGTRPDCLSKKVLEYLQELNEDIEVCIDLGIQTLNDKTLKKIDREHNAKQSLEAIKKLKEYGLKVFGHIIIGFEGEKRKDWEYTLKEIIKAGVDGIKIHNLHIIKNTALAMQYAQKPFWVMNEYEYLEELIHLLRLIPPHIPLLRTTTDTPQKDLIAPKWHMSKGEFLRFLNEEMENRDIFQGDLLDVDKKKFFEEKEDISLAKDGSSSFWDKKYKDYYHPKSGAKTQALKLFIEQSQVQKLLTCKDVNLLDIGFGMGYNTLETLHLKRNCFLNIDALDRNLQIVRKSAKLLENSLLQTLYEKQRYEDNNTKITLHVGDARYTITSLKKKFYDVIFLDPFLYTQNVTLITKDFLALVVQRLKDEGVLICSTSIQAVRIALSSLGFSSKIIQIPKTDIRGIKVQKGEQTLLGNTYEDPYLTLRDKQIITNYEFLNESIKECL
jgi:radical SAM protein (TIGR01212 family)